METILKSNFKEEWNGYPIITLPIDQIWQSVVSVEILKGKPFKKKLIEDIKTNGMNFPIMVVHTSYADLLVQKKKWGDKICDLPFWHNDQRPKEKFVWSVWGGSQRLDVAKKLGYTHIHCAHIPTVDIAISLQKVMREPYIKKYYS